MRIGVTSFAFRHLVAAGRLSPRGFLELAKAVGAEAAQPCENLLQPGRPTGELQELGRAARSLGLTLELGASCSGEDDLGAAIRMAEVCGAERLRVVLAPRASSDWIAVLRASGRVAAGAGISVAVENHFAATPREVADLIRAVGDPRVAACVDPLNAMVRLVGPAEAIRDLAPLAVTGHAKDARVVRHGVGFAVEGCPLGEGHALVRELVDALAAAGTYTLHAESWMDAAGDEEATLAREERWAREGVAFLKAAASTAEGRRTQQTQKGAGR